MAAPAGPELSDPPPSYSSTPVRGPVPALGVQVHPPHTRLGEIWHTTWVPPYSWDAPLGDFRDQLPPLIVDVHEQHRSVIIDGAWTHGLFECWDPRMRMMKAAVHIPCWESYDPWCWLWRGACFGRSCSECFWVGIHPTRWARSVYGGALSSKYSHGIFNKTWKAVIGSLSGCYCCAAVTLGMGVHWGATCGGAVGCNLMSWYSCASRLALRNRYNLPPAFGLPAGCDDCVVHLCCMYCASHQELRESAVRGIAGPGIHVLDVTERSFRHVPGIERRLSERQAEMDASLENVARVPSRVQMAVPAAQVMHRGA